MSFTDKDGHVTCCEMRSIVGMVPVYMDPNNKTLPASAADFMLTFGNALTGFRPVLMLQFCPWCGASMRDENNRSHLASIGGEGVSVDAIKAADAGDHG